MLATSLPAPSLPNVDPGLSAEALLHCRAATNLFDPDYRLPDARIERLAGLATRAPSAFILQNWRLHAVRTPRMKAALRRAAFDQAKVEEAAVTFVVGVPCPKS